MLTDPLQRAWRASLRPQPLPTPPHLPVVQQLPVLRLQLVLLLLEQDPEPVPVELQASLALLPSPLLIVYGDAKKTP